MSSHTAGLRALSRARKVGFLDSTIDLGSIIFGAVIVADVSGNTQTYYRFIILGLLFLAAWVRACHRNPTPPSPLWAALKDVSTLVCSGLASFVFSLTAEPGPPALASWTVSIFLAIPFVLLAHAISHRQDRKISLIAVAVVVVIAVLIAVIGHLLA